MHHKIEALFLTADYNLYRINIIPANHIHENLKWETLPKCMMAD
jgi:hypothetical protein